MAYENFGHPQANYIGHEGSSFGPTIHSVYIDNNPYSDLTTTYGHSLILNTTETHEEYIKRLANAMGVPVEESKVGYIVIYATDTNSQGITIDLADVKTPSFTLNHLAPRMNGFFKLIKDAAAVPDLIESMSGRIVEVFDSKKNCVFSKMILVEEVAIDKESMTIKFSC